MLPVYLTLLLGCGGPPATTRQPVAPPPSLTIFYTCDTRGHVEPCACSTGPAGGLARRQTYLNENRPEHWLLVDAGDVTGGAREWELVEFEYLLRGYQQMGYHAVNLGQREATIGLAKLRELNGRYPWFVSANVLDATGQPVVAPFALVELVNGYRVGIIGILDDRVNAADVGAGLKIAPPGDAIARYLPQLRSQADLVVLLAFADETRMRELAERFFEIDLILGGKVPQPSGTPVTVNKSLIAFNTDKGKAIGRLDLSFDEATRQVSATNDIVKLLNHVADDPALVALTREYKQRLRELDIDPEHHRADDEGLSPVGPPPSQEHD